jgi:hypothetical protein
MFSRIKFFGVLNWSTIFFIYFGVEGWVRKGQPVFPIYLFISRVIGNTQPPPGGASAFLLFGPNKSIKSVDRKVIGVD